jgi:hypothetical protein
MGYALPEDAPFAAAALKDMPIRRTHEPGTSMVQQSQEVKSSIHYIVGEIVKQWPVDEENKTRACLSLVNSYSFYIECFRPILSRLRNVELNGSMVTLRQGAPVCISFSSSLSY